MEVVIAIPYPENDASGGVQRVAENTVEGFCQIDGLLSEKGIRINILSHISSVPRLREQESKTGAVRIFRYKSLQPRSILGELQALYALRKFPSQIDILHSHTVPHALVGNLLGMDTVFTLHGMVWREVDFTNHLHSYIQNSIQEKKIPTILRNSSNVSISPYVEEEIKQHFGISPSFTNIENPISLDFFNTQIKVDSGNIFCPATIRPLKNQLALLKAAKEMMSLGHQFQIRLAGSISDEDYYQELLRYIKSNDLNRMVNFLGELEREEMINEYEKASIVCLPSIQETAPMVISEAMSMGVPVVASKVGGIPHMVSSGKDGFLVAPNDNNELANKLSVLLKDLSLRVNLAESCIETSKRWDPKTIAKNYINYYESL